MYYGIAFTIQQILYAHIRIRTYTLTKNIPILSHSHTGSGTYFSFLFYYYFHFSYEPQKIFCTVCIFSILLTNHPKWLCMCVVRIFYMIVEDKIALRPLKFNSQINRTVLCTVKAMMLNLLVSRTVHDFTRLYICERVRAQSRWIYFSAKVKISNFHHWMFYR